MIEFMPSEVARLVLGYLEEKECHKSYSTFLFECGDLAECRKLLKEGKEYSVMVGLEGQNTLLTILQEYCRLKSHVGRSTDVPGSHQTEPESTNEPPREPVFKTPDKANYRSLSKYTVNQRVHTKAYVTSMKTGSSHQCATPPPSIISATQNTMSVHIPPRRGNGLTSHAVQLNCQVVKQNIPSSPVMQCDVNSASLHKSPQINHNFGVRTPKSSARRLSFTPKEATSSNASAQKSNSCQNTPVKANHSKSETDHLMQCSTEYRTQTEKTNCPSRNINNGKAFADAENSRSLPTKDVHSTEDNNVSKTVIAASPLSDESNSVCSEPSAAVSDQGKVNSNCDDPKITSSPSSVCINSSPSVSAKVNEVVVCKITEVQVATTCTTVTDSVPSSPMDTETSEVASVGSKHDLVSATQFSATPEYCGEPPPYNRAPATNSPRIILSHERSMVASLTTPVKDWQHLKEEEWHSPKRKSVIPRRRLLSEISPVAKQNICTEPPSFSTDSPDQWGTLDDIFNFPPLAEKIAENINLVKNTEHTAEESTKVVSDRVRECSVPLDVHVPDEMIKDILVRTESDPVFEDYLNYIYGKWDSSRDGSEMSASHDLLLSPLHASASCSRDAAEIRNDSATKYVFLGITSSQPEDSRHAAVELPPKGSSETATIPTSTESVLSNCNKGSVPKPRKNHNATSKKLQDNTSEDSGKTPANSEVEMRRNEENELHSAKQNSVTSIQNERIEKKESSRNSAAATSQAQTKTASSEAEIIQIDLTDDLDDNFGFGSAKEVVEATVQIKDGSVQEIVFADNTSFSVKDSFANNAADPVTSVAGKKAEVTEPQNISVQETEVTVSASGTGDDAPFMYFLPSNSDDVSYVQGVSSAFIILPPNPDSANTAKLHYENGQSAVVSENHILSSSPLRSLVESQSLHTDPSNWGAVQTLSMETASEHDSTTSGMTTPSLPRPSSQGVQFITLSPNQLQGIATAASMSGLPMILPKVPGVERRRRAPQSLPQKRKPKNPPKPKPKRPRVPKPQKEKNIFVISQAAGETLDPGSKKEQKPKKASPRAATKRKKKPQKNCTTSDQDVDDPATVEDAAKTPASPMVQQSESLKSLISSARCLVGKGGRVKKSHVRVLDFGVNPTKSDDSDCEAKAPSKETSEKRVPSVKSSNAREDANKESSAANSKTGNNAVELDPCDATTANVISVVNTGRFRKLIVTPIKVSLPLRRRIVHQTPVHGVLPNSNENSSLCGESSMSPLKLTAACSASIVSPASSPFVRARYLRKLASSSDDDEDEDVPYKENGDECDTSLTHSSFEPNDQSDPVVPPNSSFIESNKNSRFIKHTSEREAHARDCKQKSNMERYFFSSEEEEPSPVKKMENLPQTAAPEKEKTAKGKVKQNPNLPAGIKLPYKWGKSQMCSYSGAVVNMLRNKKPTKLKPREKKKKQQDKLSELALDLTVLHKGKVLSPTAESEMPQKKSQTSVSRKSHSGKVRSSIEARRVHHNVHSCVDKASLKEEDCERENAEAVNINTETLRVDSDETDSSDELQQTIAYLNKQLSDSAIDSKTCSSVEKSPKALLPSVHKVTKSAAKMKKTKVCDNILNTVAVDVLLDLVHPKD